MKIPEIVNQLDKELWESLKLLDREEAERVQGFGCVHCGGKLHCADYPRSPRGVGHFEGSHPRRHSFCCGTCRKRQTPASSRFLGRKVYVALVVFLAASFREGESRAPMKRICGVLGMSEVTVRRWLSWWKEEVPLSAFWKESQGIFAKPIRGSSMLRSLYCRFPTLFHLAHFLSPLSVPANSPG